MKKVITHISLDLPIEAWEEIRNALYLKTSLDITEDSICNIDTLRLAKIIDREIRDEPTEDLI